MTTVFISCFSLSHLWLRCSFRPEYFTVCTIRSLNLTKGNQTVVLMIDCLSRFAMPVTPHPPLWTYLFMIMRSEDVCLQQVNDSRHKQEADTEQMRLLSAALVDRQQAELSLANIDRQQSVLTRGPFTCN